MLTTCCNHMYITGPACDITRFVRATAGKPAQYTSTEMKKTNKESTDIPEYFCFNAFSPVPQKVLRMGEFLPPKNLLNTEKGPQLHRRIACGSDWCTLNWSVPCDVWDQKITLYEQGYTRKRTTIQFQFNTFDGPPVRWLDAVFAKFPKLMFHVHYSLKDQFCSGHIWGIDGETWESELEKDYPDDTAEK